MTRRLQYPSVASPNFPAPATVTTDQIAAGWLGMAGLPQPSRLPIQPIPPDGWRAYIVPPATTQIDQAYSAWAVANDQVVRSRDLGRTSNVGGYADPHFPIIGFLPPGVMAAGALYANGLAQPDRRPVQPQHDSGWSYGHHPPATIESLAFGALWSNNQPQPDRRATQPHQPQGAPYNLLPPPALITFVQGALNALPQPDRRTSPAWQPPGWEHEILSPVSDGAAWAGAGWPMSLPQPSRALPLAQQPDGYRWPLLPPSTTDQLTAGWLYAAGLWQPSRALPAAQQPQGYRDETNAPPTTDQILAAALGAMLLPQPSRGPLLPQASDWPYSLPSPATTDQQAAGWLGGATLAQPSRAPAPPWQPPGVSLDMERVPPSVDAVSVGYLWVASLPQPLRAAVQAQWDAQGWYIVPADSLGAILAGVLGNLPQPDRGSARSQPDANVWAVPIAPTIDATAPGWIAQHPQPGRPIAPAWQPEGWRDFLTTQPSADQMAAGFLSGLPANVRPTGSAAIIDPGWISLPSATVDQLYPGWATQAPDPQRPTVMSAAQIAALTCLPLFTALLPAKRFPFIVILKAR